MLEQFDEFKFKDSVSTKMKEIYLYGSVYSDKHLNIWIT